MSRRSKWKNARDAMMSPFAQTKGVHKQGNSARSMLRKVPAMVGKHVRIRRQRGRCSVLKMGSDLKSDPPAFVLDGDTGLITFFNMDTSVCTHFQRMEVIDHRRQTNAPILCIAEP